MGVLWVQLPHRGWQEEEKPAKEGEEEEPRRPAVLGAKEGESFWEERENRPCLTLLVRKTRGELTTALGPVEVSGDRKTEVS